jgi:hypothetical protein
MSAEKKVFSEKHHPDLRPDPGIAKEIEKSMQRESGQRDQNQRLPTGRLLIQAFSEKPFESKFLF